MSTVQRESESRIRKWMRRFVRMLTWLMALGAVSAVIALIVAWFSYQKHVVREPGSHIESAHIKSITQHRKTAKLTTNNYG